MKDSKNNPSAQPESIPPERAGEYLDAMRQQNVEDALTSMIQFARVNPMMEAADVVRKTLKEFPNIGYVEGK